MNLPVARAGLFALALSAVAVGACATPTGTAGLTRTLARGVAIVAAADRTDVDRALDDGRHPAALIDFLAIEPGMHVADLGAGGGYTTELLARAVGEGGVVYGQNSQWLLERFAEKPWTARLARPVNSVVRRVDREFDDPLPPEAKGTLDVVVDVLFYHDTVWLKTDRAAMNAAIFDALKPGGRYVIVDHSAKAGAGLTVVETLHRIEESIVVAEVLGAGFVEDGSAHFLKNPQDARDWNANPSGSGDKRGTSDRFVLAFKKP
jgi:predicted methyltransferase